jgi:hypothetical protein
VSSTDLGRSPDTTITLSVDDFIRMATGNAAVAAMFVTGKVKVKGEYAPRSGSAATSTSRRSVGTEKWLCVIQPRGSRVRSHSPVSRSA